MRKQFHRGEIVEIRRAPSAAWDSAWEIATYLERKTTGGYVAHCVDLPSSAQPVTDQWDGYHSIGFRRTHVPSWRVRKLAGIPIEMLQTHSDMVAAAARCPGGVNVIDASGAVLFRLVIPSKALPDVRWSR